MSSNSKAIQKILEDSMATYKWESRTPLWREQTIEFVCYEWLFNAYPEIFREFKAVYDIEKPQE